MENTEQLKTTIMALVGAAKCASSSVSWTKFLVAGQHLYHQLCWNLAVHQTHSTYVEDGDRNANGKLYKNRVFAQCNLDQLCDVLLPLPQMKLTYTYKY